MEQLPSKLKEIMSSRYVNDVTQTPVNKGSYWLTLIILYSRMEAMPRSCDCSIFLNQEVQVAKNVGFN